MKVIEKVNYVEMAEYKIDNAIYRIQATLVEGKYFSIDVVRITYWDDDVLIYNDYYQNITIVEAEEYYKVGLEAIFKKFYSQLLK